MKPLNRPMFKNGGPIKEGIMSGMKEPQAINTVGSPLAPQDASGRQGYAVPIIGAGLMAAARFLPAAYRGFKAARFGNYAPLSQNLGAGKRFLNIFSPTAGRGAPKAPAGAGAGFRVGSFLKQNPLTALPIAGTAIEGGGRAAAGLAKMTPDLLKSYANAIIPFADPFETGKKSVETKEDNKNLKRVDNLTKEKPVGDVDTKSDKLSEDEKKKINEDRINEAKQKYYKLMGVDKLNKEATYDSLIDASKIIQEQGGDLKGNIKSGNLQSAIISAISKNLDKSTDLKRQIDAAVLKGEIEKDINKTKLTSFQEQIKFIKENPNDPLAKKLAGATSVADIVAASAAQGKSSTITSGDIASMIDSKGTNVSGTIADDEYQKWFKSNKNKDEIDFFIEKYSGADDGLYVVNKKAFIKRGNEIAPVSLDSIIG